MLNEREMKYRIKCAEDAGIPMTNYGTAIANVMVKDSSFAIIVEGAHPQL